MQDFTAFREWAKLKPETWTLVATELGEAELSDLATVAAVEDADYVGAMASLKAVDRARLNLLVNAVRKKVGLEVGNLLRKPEPQAPAAKSSVPEASNKVVLKASQFLDQASRFEVHPIAEELILEMRKRWKDKMWLDPQPHVDISDNQLSVLARLQDLNHNLLAFDMGVWGPYGTRRERQYMLTAYHQNATGEWIAREVPGAQTVDEWCDGWNFATTGFVMGNIVEKGLAEPTATTLWHWRNCIRKLGGSPVRQSGSCASSGQCRKSAGKRLSIQSVLT